VEQAMSDGHWQLEGNAAELYQRYLVPGITSKWAEDLVHRAQLCPGEEVLDVACGTGVVARLAAQKVASGHVTGLDLNAGMLAVARGVDEGALVNWMEAALLICHSLPAISTQYSASSDFNSFLISQKPCAKCAV
jgi:trans-aconitate methyltransferase